MKMSLVRPILEDDIELDLTEAVGWIPATQDGFRCQAFFIMLSLQLS